MEEDEENPQNEGGGTTGVQILFQICSAGGVALWLGDLGGHPPHRKGPWWVSGPSVETDDGASPVEET